MSKDLRLSGSSDEILRILAQEGDESAREELRRRGVFIGSGSVAESTKRAGPEERRAESEATAAKRQALRTSEGGFSPVAAAANVVRYGEESLQGLPYVPGMVGQVLDMATQSPGERQRQGRALGAAARGPIVEGVKRGVKAAWEDPGKFVSEHPGEIADTVTDLASGVGMVGAALPFLRVKPKLPDIAKRGRELERLAGAAGDVREVPKLKRGRSWLTHDGYMRTSPAIPLDLILDTQDVIKAEVGSGYEWTLDGAIDAATRSTKTIGIGKPGAFKTAILRNLDQSLTRASSWVDAIQRAEGKAIDNDFFNSVQKELRAAEIAKDAILRWNPLVDSNARRGAQVPWIAGSLTTAWKNLPQFERARMKRAVDMGFDVEAYHGTRALIEQFDPAVLGTATQANSARLGFFFAADRQTPEAYHRGFRVATARDRLTEKMASMHFGADAVGGESLRKSIQNQALEGLPRVFPQTPMELKESFYQAMLEAGVDPKTRLEWGAGDSPTYSDFINLSGDEAEYLPSEVRSALEGLKQSPQEAKMLEMWDEILRNYHPVAPSTLPVLLKMDNPYVYDCQGKSYIDIGYTKRIKYAQEHGYDSVVLHNTPDGGPPTDIYVVFKPEQIRSRYAMFDPEKASSPDLIASTAPWMVPIGITTAAEAYIRTEEDRRRVEGGR